jgi:hypothetical protein
MHRYLFLRDSNKTQCRNASDIANLYLEPCAIPKPMKAIVSHVDGDGRFPSDFTISIFQGFRPGSHDMSELMAHLNAERDVLGVTNDTPEITVLLRGLASSAADSTKRRPSSNACIPSIINFGAMRFGLTNEGGPWLDKVALKSLFDDFFHMLHSAVMQASGKQRLQVVANGFNADDSILVCQAVSLST